MKFLRNKLARLRRSVLRVLRLCLWLGVVAVVLDVAYLAWIWPDWASYQQGPIQRSNFIRDYEAEQRGDPGLPELRWNPVPLQRISRHMERAVIVGEGAADSPAEGETSGETGEGTP